MTSFTVVALAHVDASSARSPAASRNARFDEAPAYACSASPTMAGPVRSRTGIWPPAQYALRSPAHPSARTIRAPSRVRARRAAEADLAADPGGPYFDGVKRGTPNAAAGDAALARRRWDVSERLTGATINL